MAGEIKTTVTVNVSKGEYKLNVSETKAIDQAAIGSAEGVISIGTSEEDMDVGDVGTLGVLLLKNLDTTNYVTYGPKSAGSMVAFGRIKPGEVVLLRLEPGITLRWAANTASVKIRRILLEN